MEAGSSHRFQKVRFRGGSGDSLAGFLHEPQGKARGCVVLSHCFTCSKNYKIMSRLARGLSEKGWIALRFDFTGLGESKGSFEETTLSSDISDVLAAAEWLRGRGHAPDVLVGHSMGGATSVFAARDLPSVRGVCVMGTPPETTHMLSMFTPEDWRRIEIQGLTVKQIGGRDVPITREFLSDLKRYETAETARQLKRPFLILHGAEDRLVQIGEAERFFARLRQPKAFVTIPRADHLFSEKEHAEAVVDVLAVWMRRCLAPAEDSAAES